MNGDLNWAAILHGIPGCGKSSFARTVRNNDESVIVCGTDDARRDLGIRADDITETDRVYSITIRKAAEFFHAGKNVILDATFYLRRFRLQAQRELSSPHGTLLLVTFIVPESVCVHRISERAATRQSPYGGVNEVPRFADIVNAFQQVDEAERSSYQGVLSLEFSSGALGARLICGRIPRHFTEVVAAATETVGAPSAAGDVVMDGYGH